MADKNVKKEKKQSTKEIKKKDSSIEKDKTKKITKSASKKYETKYSIDELCLLFSISKFEAKSHYLVNKIDEKEKITKEQFKNFFKK